LRDWKKAAVLEETDLDLEIVSLGKTYTLSCAEKNWKAVR